MKWLVVLTMWLMTVTSFVSFVVATFYAATGPEKSGYGGAAAGLFLLTVLFMFVFLCAVDEYKED